MYYRLIAVAVAAALAGCAAPRDPVPPPAVVIEVPGPVRYIPVPPEHLVPCTFEERPLVTVGDLYATRIDLREALQVCDSQIQAIRDLMRPR